MLRASRKPTVIQLTASSNTKRRMHDSDLNPYESPVVVSKQNGQARVTNVRVRVAWAVIGTFSGGFSAAMISPLIWLMFYAFEGSVIEEERYLSGPPPFLPHLILISAVAGLAYGYVTLHRALFAISTHAFAGSFFSFLGAALGWYWTQALTLAAVAQILVPLFLGAILWSSSRAKIALDEQTNSGDTMGTTGRRTLTA